MYIIAEKAFDYRREVFVGPLPVRIHYTQEADQARAAEFQERDLTIFDMAHV